MPAVSSTPDDVTATISSSAPAIIDLRADYNTIEKNIVAASSKNSYEKN